MRTMNYDSKGNLRQTVDNGKYAKDFNYDENGNFLYAVDYIGNVEQEVLTHERYIGSFTCPYFQFMCKFFRFCRKLYFYFNLLMSLHLQECIFAYSNNVNFFLYAN